MKILVADRISPIGVDLFKAEEDFEVIEAYGSSPEEILELVKDVDGLAVRSETKVSPEVLRQQKNLKWWDVPELGLIILILRRQRIMGSS